MSVSNELTTLQNTKTAIKSAITSKGQTVGDDFSTYADAILDIETDFETETLTVIPSTVDLVNTPTTDGFSTVTVKGVTSAIDGNITANNIRSGVSILGVSGNLTELKGTTKTISSNGTYTPNSNYNGFTRVTVNVSPRYSIKTITTNGTHDVTDYASVYVNISQDGVLEQLFSDIVAGNNPVSVTNLQTLEQNISGLI